MISADFGKEELEEWKANKITRYMMYQINQEIERLSGILAGGGTLDGDRTGQLTARAVGEITGLDWVLQETFLEGHQDQDD